MQGQRALLIAAAAVGLLFTQCAQARDWTRFRGPNGSGVSEATTVPVEWAPDDYRWEAVLPGEGISSPVVWDDTLFITSADGDRLQRYLLAIDTGNGRLKWTREFGFAKYKLHSNSTYANNTPACDERHVYVLWQQRESSSLSAFTHGGDRVWSADLGAYQSGHGTGSSPVVAGDLVIVCNDHDGDNSAVLAFDALTGEIRWRVPRSGSRACYSTPCVFQPEERSAEIVVTHSFEGIAGIDAATGRQNWAVDVFGRFPQRAIGSPVIYRDLVIGSSGFTTAEKNVVAVRPYAEDGAGAAVEVYRVSRGTPHIPSPLVHRDRLFLWSDTGIVTCADAETGEIRWQKRVGGNFQCSPICVNGRIYCSDRDGTVVVLAAADEYQLLARNALGRPTQSTPAVSGGKLFIRTHSHVVAIGGEGD